MGEAGKEVLCPPFPLELVRERLGQNGRTLHYIDVASVVARLNEGCDAWDFAIERHEVLEGEVIVLGRLVADGVTACDFGGSTTTTTQSGAIVSIADDLKAAASDALKKAAWMLPEAVLGIEVAFSVTLKHPRDPSEEIAVPLVGALDALVVENGEPVIWELKTSRKRYSATELEITMLQPTVYTVGARVLDVEDPEVAVIVATKAKQPAVQISRLRRYETDESELYELAQQVLRAVSAGVYPRNRGHACVTCAHRTECAP